MSRVAERCFKMKELLLRDVNVTCDVDGGAVGSGVGEGNGAHAVRGGLAHVKEVFVYVV